MLARCFLTNEQLRIQTADSLKLKKMFLALQNANIQRECSKLGIISIIPVGSYVLGCLRKTKPELDLIAHVNSSINL